MKISVIGAGNVGSLTALRLTQENLGSIVLLDIVKGLAQGKAFDLEDARPLLRNDYAIQGSDDFSTINGSNIVVVTAGLARKPGMTREELLNKNAAILKDICLKVKELASDSILIIVTNPLDLMTYFALKVTGFSRQRLFGMGISLDGARFANIIAKNLNVSPAVVDAQVIGPHGEGMLPLPRFSKIRNEPLNKIIDEDKVNELVKKTVGRGAEILSLLNSGSAYFAPSAAICEIIRAIVNDQNKNIGVCAYLEGEYGIKDICIGVPAIIGKQGILKIVELDLNKQEREALITSAASLKGLADKLPF